VSAVLSSLETVCQMLNQVLKVSPGTCQQFVNDAVKISNISGLSTFTRQCSNILQVRWKSLWCVYREFSYESSGKRIMKIGPHLPTHNDSEI